MAIELRLAKSDAATPWGFRLTGGANLEIPLTTIKVVEDGIAQSCGLRVGDVIIRINDEDIAGLSHGQAHDRIVQSGNELYFTVVRTGLSEVLKSLIQEEEDKQNEEISNLLTGSVPIDYPEKTIDDLMQDEEDQSKVPQHDLNLTDEEIHSIINPEIVTKKEKSNNKPMANPELKEIRQPQNTEMEKQPITQEEVKFMQSEVIKEINNTMKQASEAERRWSTFLQKPKRPVPATAPKFQVQKSTYKVKIRTKKDLEIERAAKQAKLEAEALIAQITETAEKTELKIAADGEESDDDFVSSDSDFSFSDDSENCTESTITFTPSDTEPTISFTESLNSLEEKLEQVKEQLQIYNVELVPDHLQKILTKIANKLEKIVKVVKPVTKDMPQQNGDATDDDVDYDELDFSDDESSIESISINSDISTPTPSTPSYQGTEPTLTFSSYSIMSDEPSAMTPEGTEPTISFSDEHADVAECDRTEFDVTEMQDYQEPIKEDITQPDKEEKTSKKDKDRNKMEPDGPQVPLVRPIILPGGRKWGAPDDAVRSATRRHASLTDERIDQTISSYYEVIDGKTVGINFLKYQPPPKNLDHLKNSEVFKMVHNMDTEQQPAGIFSRPEKVLSEQDYHVNNVNQIPSPLPR